MSSRTDTPRVGVALIGAGMIAQTHVSALSSARKRVWLEAIVSQSPNRAEHLAEFYAGDTPVFTSELSVVLENPDVQVVIVATPPSVRIELIEALAQAGKHILLEKPVARTVDEAVQVVEICERARVMLGVVFQHRMRASSKAAARHIESGALGALGVVEIAVPLWRDQSYYDALGRGTYSRDGGGVLITQAIHTIDLALSLVGPVASVQAMTATTRLHTMESEDFAVAGLRFFSGAVGSLVASTAMFPHRRESITLHFEYGSLFLSDGPMTISWRNGRIEQEPAVKVSEGEDGPVIAKHELHQAVIEDFIDAVRLNRQPIANGCTALNSHRLIEAIEASSRSGKPVSVKRSPDTVHV